MLPYSDQHVKTMKETSLIYVFSCSSGINSMHPHVICSNINLLMFLLADKPSLLYTQNHHIGQTTGRVSAWIMAWTTALIEQNFLTDETESSHTQLHLIQ